jgi:hypothetical protein
MLKHVSARLRKETPHLNHTTRTATIMNALTRRAQAVLNDKSINAQSRAVIRYALETHDPWLADLVRRADAGETIDDTIDFSGTPTTTEDDSSNENIAALTEMICRSGDEPGKRSAALLVLMARLENASHPKALANSIKHLALTRCSDLNICGIVDAQIAILESELLPETRS